MGFNTKIEWADHSWNPWVGCTAISPACDHCYAEAMMDKRLHVVKWGAGEPRKRTSDKNWREPLKWNADAAEKGIRYRVFCASLADVFDNEVPVGWRVDLLRLIEKTPHLDWLLLTKRIGNVESMLDECARLMPEVLVWPMTNVWLGATICNQEEADRDIPKLLKVPAAKRFLSMEPLLGPVDLASAYSQQTFREALRQEGIALPHSVVDQHTGMPEAVGEDLLPGLHWVIVGGESGHGARPMHPDWVRALRDQCVASGAAFHFKQWGEWAPVEDVDAVSDGIEQPLHYVPEHEMTYLRTGKQSSGRQLDGRTWDEVPHAA